MNTTYLEKLNMNDEKKNSNTTVKEICEINKTQTIQYF